MRFAEDRRARVPFALVGILLLVGSAGLSATLAGGPTPRTDESVGVAMDRTTAATNTALREAVARAGRQAASAPVTATANTTAGRVLNNSTPFRDYLRLRIYLAASRALDSVSVRVGNTEGDTTLPETANASALRRAKRRVEIQPAGNATTAGLRVRIENVSVTATRDGQTLAHEEVSPVLVVATPALALHRRVQRFESRLNRGPLDPGLGRRLTARLYALAWVRGYAQYGRAPISNVVANRHVELATNGAILREQRLAFGRSDPAGREALRWATARVAALDLLSAANAKYGSAGTSALLTAANQYQRENPMPGGVATGEAATRGATPSTTFNAGVNRTADRAFADLVTGENATSLTGVLKSAYTADARLVAAVRQTEAESRPSPDPPGANWTLRGTDVRTTTGTEPVGESSSEPPPGTPSGWHVLGHETRRVVRTHTLVANWTRTGGTGENGTTRNETRQTSQSWTEEYVVGVGVAGNHRQRVVPRNEQSRSGTGAQSRSAADAHSHSDAGAQARPVAGVHEHPGALGGPNFRDVAAKAEERLVSDRGGFDALARRAVAGTLDTRQRAVTGRRPTDLWQWVYRDLATLRERVRNVSVAVSGHSTLDREAAAAELVGALRERRKELINAPQRYDGIADRAKVAARAAYLDRVVARLEARAERANATRTGIDQALADAGTSLGRVREVLRARGTPRTPSARAIPAAGPGRVINLSVVGAPPYLTLAALDHEAVATIPPSEKTHPLAARNVNVFAAPYGEAASAVASAVTGSDDAAPTDLGTAAVALRVANRTLAEADNQTLADAENRTLAEADNRTAGESANQTLARRREKLQQSLSGSMQDVRRNLVAELGTGRFDLTQAERRAAVDAGLAQWNTTHGRALAVANGSAAQAIVAAVVARRPPLRRADRRDWLSLRTELALESVRQETGGPPRSLVNRTTSATRSVAETALKQALSDGLARGTEEASKRWFGEVLGAIPAGLPVAPVPGYWYATVNVWTVSVEGEYARFAVSAPQGPPGETVTYVREENTVRVDWDGDGEREVVGQTTPLSFETETVVAVVVPPGSPGVGDRDGKYNESSPGWSGG